MILKRVITEENCPGTCCKAIAYPPFSGENGDCVEWKKDFPGRINGGCGYFNLKNACDPDKKKIWESVCKALPYVKIGTIDKNPRHTFMHKNGIKWCECFEWVENGN